MTRPAGRSVVRRGEGAGPQEPPALSLEAARKLRGQAFVRFAMFETPAALALAIGLGFLFATDHGLSEDTVTAATILLVIAFALYVVTLYAAVLRPALREASRAEAAARRAERDG